MKLEKAAFESAAGLPSQLPECTMPEIVFAGRSNVGKSSLINRLLNRKSLARVSSQPGKTATINFYNCDGARLVDLPGYGYAKVSHAEKARWADLIDGYFEQGRDVRLVILLIDSRHRPSADDITMLDYLEQTGFPTLIALTKIDKLNKSERAARLAALPEELECSEDMLIPFSSVTGEGADALREILFECVE